MFNFDLYQSPTGNESRVWSMTSSDIERWCVKWCIFGLHVTSRTAPLDFKFSRLYGTYFSITDSIRGKGGEGVRKYVTSGTLLALCSSSVTLFLCLCKWLCWAVTYRTLCHVPSIHNYPSMRSVVSTRGICRRGVASNLVNRLLRWSFW